MGGIEDWTLGVCKLSKHFTIEFCPQLHPGYNRLCAQTETGYYVPEKVNL